MAVSVLLQDGPPGTATGGAFGAASLMVAVVLPISISPLESVTVRATT